MQSIDNIKPLNWTVLCHLAGLIGLFFPLGNIILPIIIWLKKSEQYPEVYKHGVAVINFQISWTIYMIISGLLVFLIIGLPFVIGLSIFGLVVSIKGVLVASEAQFYHYPLSIEFLKINKGE